MFLTTLSTLLNRMNRYQPISTIEEQYKVNDLDEALRTLGRSVKTPWLLKKSTLRVFKDVLVYPVASDHDELAFLSSQKKDQFANFYYTSIQEFYENYYNQRNDLAEIWENGTKYLGVRYDDSSNLSSQKLDSLSFTASGDASDVTIDTVIYKESDSSSSVRFLNTVNTGVATMSSNFTNINDTSYKNKYLFAWIYLSSVPTNIILKFGNDVSNYLSATVTTQFSGQAFTANDWNLVAIDLGTATETGTISSSAFDYLSISLTGASAGYYYIDNIYLKKWALLDYRYYSNYNVKTSSASIANQAYFINPSTEAYATDSALVGDYEWADVIMFDAILTGIADEKDGSLYPVIANKRQDAWDKLMAKYPDMVPLITTSKYEFSKDYNIDTNLIR